VVHENSILMTNKQQQQQQDHSKPLKRLPVFAEAELQHVPERSVDISVESMGGKCIDTYVCFCLRRQEWKALLSVLK